MAGTDNTILNNLANTPSIPAGLENAPIKDVVDYLFSNGNRLLTATGAPFELNKDTQSLIAYFSGGEIIVSRTHRYDGRVLAFMDLLRKRGRQVRAPFYSDLGLLSTIYKTYEGRIGDARGSVDYDNQMQNYFVDIFDKDA